MMGRKEEERDRQRKKRIEIGSPVRRIIQGDRTLRSHKKRGGGGEKTA